MVDHGPEIQFCLNVHVVRKCVRLLKENKMLVKVTDFLDRTPKTENKSKTKQIAL